jgi:hypothetical protein
MSFAGAGKDNVEVWKVSGGGVEKIAELGTFHVNSLYLVFNKKAGIIHMWFGNVKLNLSGGDATAWMDKAMELNVALGGTFPIYTEMEGFETPLFMSCFKKSGVTYKTSAGGSEHKLLQVKGKGGKKIKEVSMSSTYFASLKDVFILDAGAKIFLQAGPRASLYDRIVASGVADEINTTQRGGKSTVVYMYEDAMNDEFWAHFKV